jgi:hypothetical protein
MESILEAGATSSPCLKYRAHPRYPVDTRATLHLVDVGARLPGRILNVSLGGCLIHTDNRFPIGVFRRVEVEFRLQNMPFRLAAVTQRVYDRYKVGIRFVEMSERKFENLAGLLREIQESMAPDPFPGGA